MDFNLEKSVKISGLSTKEVEKRKLQGKINIEEKVITKSIRRIFLDNILTLFNLINIILFVLLLVVGSYENTLFMFVVLFNTAIGIIQEIRSKISVDKLSILVTKQATVIRNGETADIPVNEIVLDDILILSSGNQIPSDAVVISGECFVNESLLTGESKSILKTENSQLLSGSFVTAGKCIAKVVKVGKDNYVSTINKSAKYIKKVKSEIMTILKKIIKLNSIVIFPIGIALFYSQYMLESTLTASSQAFQNAVVGTVAGLIGMIPEGLMLLTSTVLAVSVIRLSRSKVLVQELHCIETLARVDVLCLDKTGTITCDAMEVTEVVPFQTTDTAELDTALASLAAASEDSNSTINAVKEQYQSASYEPAQKFIPFSSEQKWSGVVLQNGVSYIMGAGEYILKDKFEQVKDIISKFKAEYRVLTVAKTKDEIKIGALGSTVEPIGFVLIKDKIRDNAKETITYFKEQGVGLKVISGDNVKTVQNIAEAAGIDSAHMAVDATQLNTDEELYAAAETYTVFGRTTPEQKLKLVQALKKQGHSVAMTGDGVNDVLALKEADCSVAMAAGSEAARNVSQIVLTNNDFSAMPKVVAEGRRCINNIQRSASLFLVKTIFSMILSVLFIFVSTPYPFEPIQMTLISTFTIGFPSFVLAMEPNKDRVTGNFFYNIISKAFPCSLTMAVNIILLIISSKIFDISQLEYATLAVILTGFSGILLLIKISVPFSKIRLLLVFVVSACFTGGIVLGSTAYQHIFKMGLESFTANILLVVLLIIAFIVFNLLYFVSERFFLKLDFFKMSKK